jgi:hypothetical protein
VPPAGGNVSRQGHALPAKHAKSSSDSDGAIPANARTRRCSMTRHVLVALCGLFIGGLAVGCQAEVIDPDEEAAAVVGETEQAMPINCVGQCVWWYRACVNAGLDPIECAAEREACKDICDEQTCEPHEPGCCQGQPTCW